LDAETTWAWVVAVLAGMKVVVVAVVMTVLFPCRHDLNFLRAGSSCSCVAVVTGWLCWWHIVLIAVAVLLCYCVDVLMTVSMCWRVCRPLRWCVDELTCCGVDVLTCCGIDVVLMCLWLC
jgi:chromate transport protein ChrA